MRIVVEGSMVALPAVALGAVVLSWPTSGDEPIVFWVACPVFSVTTMALAFRGLRHPAVRSWARASALLLSGLTAYLSLGVAAIAAAGTVWALIEISLDDRPRRSNEASE